MSDRLDEPVEAPDRDLDRHLTTCATCRSFAQRLDGIRRQLHLQPVGATPDIAPRVRARLELGDDGRVAALPRTASRTGALGPRTTRRLLPAAAAVFVTAFVLSAAVIGLPGPPDARAIDVRALVLDGQSALRSLTATVEVTEHGWHPEVPTRDYLGELSYAAPETLHLELTDETGYPDGSWRANDVTLVVDDTRAWASGRARCLPAGMPACIPMEPQIRATDGREPFDPEDPVPLDLVLPVASFVIGGVEEPLGERELEGRLAVGVEVTVAQVAPLLEGIHRHGNWRPVHPTDAAEVWLDAELGIPLLVEVRASGGTERQRWASAVGVDDDVDSPVLSWRLRGLRINGQPPDAPPQPPSAAEVRDRGFRDSEVQGPVPEWLPDGMEPHRRGRRGDTIVMSYADGRAWLSIRSTTQWEHPRLFGQPTTVVQRVRLDGAGVAYVAEGGNRVLLHGDDLDVEVVGSLPTAELIRIAGGLGVEGLRVPDSWDEGASISLEGAAAQWPGLLTLPQPVEDYAGPGVAASPEGVVQSFVGAGDLAFTLSQVPGDTLGPPVDAVVLTVEVRGRPARYTPDRGTLEWVEDDRVVTLRSRTVEASELVAIADALEPVG